MATTRRSLLTVLIIGLTWCLAVYAGAADVIQKPNAGVVATAGATTAIVWVPVGQNDQGMGSVTITLVQGNGTSLKTVITIAQGIADSQGSYSWTVPANILSGNDYSVALFNDMTGTVFSNYFVIEGVNSMTTYSYSQAPALITPPSTSVKAASYSTPGGTYTGATTTGTVGSLLSSAMTLKSSASTESNAIAASTDTAPPVLGGAAATSGLHWLLSLPLLSTVGLLLCASYGSRL